MTTQLPRAGWYPDPAGSGRLRYFNGATWTDQYSPPPPPVAARARRRRSYRPMTPRARLIVGISLVVVGLLFAIGGVVELTSSHYGQPGAVVCNGHPMGRDEICRYGGHSLKSSESYVENYDQKLAHQKSTAQQWPLGFLGLGLFGLLLGGGLILWVFYKHRRDRLLQPPQPG